MRVSRLAIYPVKSCRGIWVDSAEVTETGFEYDRRWMLVDAEGRFVTQRTQRGLARIHVSVTDALVVSAEGMSDLSLPLRSDGATRRVQIFSDEVEAVTVSRDADAWFTEAIGSPLSLVWMADRTVRPVDPEFAAGARVGFADGFPFLILSEASVADLSERIGRPLSMDRFRPNIVLDGCAPYYEDECERLRIGDVSFSLVKRCGRCTIVTIDQQTLEADPNVTRVLAGYRTRDGAVKFGQNAVPDGRGVLCVSDQVTVV